MNDFSHTFVVNQSPDAVIAAICDVRAWWADNIAGRAERAGDRFRHQVLDLHRCDIEVTDIVPQRKVAWTVLDNYFSFTKDTTEWKGTSIVFELARPDDRSTQVMFTHVGLVPEYECYDICRDGWTTYLESLRQLIETGTGQPNVGEARTESEEALVRAKADGNSSEI